MNARRVEVTFSVEEWAKLESSRGRESRASFVKHHYLGALESALCGAEEPVLSSGRSAVAPSRASEPSSAHAWPDGKIPAPVDRVDVPPAPLPGELPGVQKGVKGLKSRTPSVASTWRR